MLIVRGRIGKIGKKREKNFFEKFTFFQKLKSVKHIEIIVAVILGAIILLVYFSTFSTKSSENIAYEATSSSEYAAMLEKKLASVIGQINGAGNVSVMITLASGPEYIYATNNEEKKI